MSRNDISQLAEMSTGILRKAVEEHGASVIFLTSFGAEDMVITHLAHSAGLNIRHVSIDTGRLPEETYNLMERTTRKYGVMPEVLFPERKSVEEMVAAKGMNHFYESRANREECCHVRKVEPLQRALSGVSAWISGIRRDQTSVREKASSEEVDSAHGGITKYNPLIDWTSADIWEFISENSVPYNSLFDRGYRSIGCAPCTRAVRPWEEERSGRWWWETGAKECGLHTVGSNPFIFQRSE